MKKIVLLSLCLIGFMPLSAQITDSVTPVNLRGFMENLFSGIDPSPITTGVLMEKGVVNIDFRDFDGSASMEATSSQGAFYSVYNQLYYGHLDTTETGTISPDSLADLYRWHNAEKTTAIALTLFDYNYLSSEADANEEPYFTEVNDVLYDNPNSEGSPYGQSTVFIAGPHEAKTKSRFIVPSSMFFSNKANIAQANLQIDFSDGNSWQSIAFDQEYPIVYSEIGEKTVKVKLTVNSVDYYCAFNVNVTKSASAVENHLYDDMWDDPLTSSEAHILYGTGNGSKIMRPVIFVEGFDYQDEFDEDDLFVIMNSGEFNTQGLVRRLQVNGYDVIILNYLRRGGRSMRDNAEVLHRLITWVNAEKAANGSSHQNVVGGASMGGVIARYTLAKMEQESCEDHQTRLYISYDAPHQGAYIPLSMQYLLNFSNRISFGLVSDLRSRMNEIRSYAAQQLFTSHILNNGAPLSAHNSFYQELDNIGYPQKTRNIAVSLGNSTTSWPINTSGGTYNAGNLIMEINKGGYCTWCTQIESRNYAVNTSGSGLVSTLKATFYRPKWFGGRKSEELSNSSFSYVSPVERDNVSGGFLETHSEVAFTVNASLNHSTASIPNNRFWHNIISTPSAIDYISPQSVTTLNRESKYQLLSNHKVPFDDILFADVSSTFFHAGVLPETVNNFFFDEITQALSVNPIHVRFIKSPLRYEVYNFGNPEITLLQSVSIETNGVLSINETGSTAYLNGPASSQSHFDVVTMPCSEVIIESGGQLKVGESSSKTGTLHISGDSKLVIKNGGKLTVYDGSSVIIEDGSHFIFEEGAQIELVNYGSFLTLRGKLTVGDNADFTFTGLGRLIFDQAIPWGDNGLELDDYWDIGENATFTVYGPFDPINYDHLLLQALKPVYMKMEDGTTFANVDIRAGRIALHEGTLFFSFSPTTLKFVKVNSAYTWHDHGGFRLWNNEGHNEFTACRFDNGNPGLLLHWLEGRDPAIINATQFTDCNRGLWAEDGSIKVMQSTFTDNITGIFGRDLTGQSTVSNTVFTAIPSAGVMGIDLIGQSGASLNVSASDFSGHHTALEARSMDMRSSCSKYWNNDLAIQLKNGILDIGAEARNQFYANNNDIHISGNWGANTGIILDDGYNDFEERICCSNYYIQGHIVQGAPLGQDPLPANNNKIPTYTSNGIQIMPVLLSYTAPFSSNLVVLDIPNNLTNVEACEGGGAGGTGQSSTFTAVEEFPSSGGIITTENYPGSTLQAAALDAIQDVTFDDEDIRDDQTAVLKITEILNADIAQPDSYTNYMQSMLYRQLHKALNNCYQFGSMVNTANEDPEVNETIQSIIGLINNYLAIYQPGDSSTYAAKFKYTLDQSHVYRISGYYDHALALLNSPSTWTFNQDQVLRAGYWQCACQVEKSYFEGEIAEEEYIGQKEDCRAQYPNHAYKSASATAPQGPGYVVDPLSSIKFYPQPVEGKLFIEILPSYTGEVGYTISDISGKTLRQGTWNWDGLKHEYDASYLNPGVYLIQMTFGETTETVKFVKE